MVAGQCVRNKTRQGVLFEENNQRQGSSMRSDMKQSYQYNVKVDYFIPLIPKQDDDDDDNDDLHFFIY